MEINRRTALVTGANRGLGRYLAEQLRDRGAHVYAAARNPETVDLDGVTPIRLDLNSEASIAEAVTATNDISILVNNAGTLSPTSLLTGSMVEIRAEFDTNFYGTLLVTRAFAPQLAEQDQSTLLTILSVLSWVSFPAVGPYCATKAAAWSMVNSLRQELAEQGTTVSALHVGYMDTDMAAGVTDAKSSPSDVARLAIDGLEQGTVEIIADEISTLVRGQLGSGVAGLYPQFA
ncbi:MAG TPA: SDR family oxidoreductase [Acidimicrobiales bacterium]|nr:SDR family oxidoreductase [Acidimicrobiales bacterium]